MKAMKPRLKKYLLMSKPENYEEIMKKRRKWKCWKLVSKPAVESENERNWRSMKTEMKMKEIWNEVAESWRESSMKKYENRRKSISEEKYHVFSVTEEKMKQWREIMKNEEKWEKWYDENENRKCRNEERKCQEMKKAWQRRETQSENQRNEDENTMKREWRISKNYLSMKMRRIMANNE